MIISDVSTYYSLLTEKKRIDFKIMEITLILISIIIIHNISANVFAYLYLLLYFIKIMCNYTRLAYHWKNAASSYEYLTLFYCKLETITINFV